MGGHFDTTCFSFHPRKIVTTGDGGMITTNSKKIAEMARLYRHQGMGISDVTRHKSTKIIHESYPVVGYNFRMTDVQAAIGIEQFKKLPKFLKKRKLIAKRYSEAFKNSQLIVPPFVPRQCDPNWQSYIIRLRNNKKVTRDSLMQKLLDSGISTRRGIMASHLEPPYRKLYPKLSLPETESATNETICLPIYHQMKSKEQQYIIDKINFAIKKI